MYEVNEKLYAVCHNGIFPCVVRKICDDGIAVDIIQKHYVTETKYKWGNEEKIAKQGADIAPTENNETALERYVVGSYIFRNDELYKVISEIPYGATFTSNNIQKTTIMDELLSKLQEV